MSLSDPSPWWPLPDAEAVRDELLAAYADPSRGYHDTLHLCEVCVRLDELADAGATYDRVPVLLAAWFHDGVYDGESGAEARSARWAAAALHGLGRPDDEIAEVVRLVLLTEHHRPEDGDDNGAALSDADLAILAAPVDRYREYVATVRDEYAHVPEDLFAAGRAEVMEKLLAAPALFNTAYAREHWESQARANVTAELETLHA